MFLTTEEIQTHLYGEVVKTIDRDESKILQSAIDAAVAEVKGYLVAYDLEAIFSHPDSEDPGGGEAEDDRNPILLLFTKDIAVWHFIQLANPNVDLELRADRYEKAVKWLDKVMRGQIVPDLPVKGPEPGENANNFIKWGGNKPRHNYF